MSPTSVAARQRPGKTARLAEAAKTDAQRDAEAAAAAAAEAKRQTERDADALRHMEAATAAIKRWAESGAGEIVLDGSEGNTPADLFSSFIHEGPKDEWLRGKKEAAEEDPGVEESKG